MISYNKELEERCEHLEEELHRIQNEYQKKYDRWRSYKDRLEVYEKARDEKMASEGSRVNLAKDEVQIQVIGRVGTGKTAIAAVCKQAIEEVGLDCRQTNMDNDVHLPRNFHAIFDALRDRNIRVSIVERQSRRAIMP